VERWPTNFQHKYSQGQTDIYGSQGRAACRDLQMAAEYQMDMSTREVVEDDLAELQGKQRMPSCGKLCTEPQQLTIIKPDSDAEGIAMED
jgi:hypothetical protein